MYTKVARKSKKKNAEKKKKKPTKGLSSTTGCHPRPYEVFAQLCAARKNRARKSDMHQKCRATPGIFGQLVRHTDRFNLADIALNHMFKISGL